MDRGVTPSSRGRPDITRADDEQVWSVEQACVRVGRFQSGGESLPMDRESSRPNPLDRECQTFVVVQKSASYDPF